MNVNFKLVWFENEDSAYDAHIDEIESIIREFHLIPDVQRYRCDEYSVEIIEDSDLILADYDLGTDNSVNIINNAIRKNDIVVDALLYSSRYSSMVDAIKKVNPMMEGIYCAKRGRGDLMDKLRNLIYRIVRRAQTVENLRGFVMEYSSIFDKQLYDLITKYCGDEEVLACVLDYFNSDLADNKKARAYKLCAHEGKNCDRDCDIAVSSCGSKSECCFKAQNVVDLTLLEKEEFFTKSRIFDHIIKHLIPRKCVDAKYRDFHRNFYKEIIVYRNALAHQYSDENRLYIRDDDRYIDIDQKLFDQIRESIAKYIEIFRELNQNNTDVFISQLTKEMQERDLALV